jgi:DNA-binding SARP family transcriptional activator
MSMGQPPEVQVTIVGPFGVHHHGQIMPSQNIGSRKARMLLALLAVDPRRLTGVEAIAEALWAAAPRRAAQDIATLVSRLRAALGWHAVAGGRAGYRLGEAVQVDLHDAVGYVNIAVRQLRTGEHPTALRAASSALHLLQPGGVLDDMPTAEWAEPARLLHAASLRQARHTMAEAALRTANAELARQAATAALHSDPFDEAACRLVMRAHAAAGEPARAAAEFQRLRVRLAEELGIDPAAETQDLHVALLRGEAAPAPVASAVPKQRPASPAPPASAPRAAAPAAARLFGRRTELATLRSRWRRSMTGHPGLVLVTGEAGYGKTTLVQAFVRLTGPGGALVAWTRCHPAERTLQLEPMVALAAQLPSVSAASAGPDPADRRVAEAAAHLQAAETAEPGGVCFAVAAYLRRLSASRPVLIVIEDVQNADTATVRLLRYTVRHLGNSRVLLIATARTEVDDRPMRMLDDVADQISLGPLQPHDIAGLAATLGQPDAATDVLRRTQGHPLFAVALAGAMVRGERQLPESVHAVVTERLRDAGTKAEELLRAAATLGSVVDPLELTRMLGIGPADAARRCHRAHQARLIRPSGAVYQFANDLVRQAVQDSTPVPVRRLYERLRQQVRGAAQPPARVDGGQAP